MTDSRRESNLNSNRENPLVLDWNMSKYYGSNAPLSIDIMVPSSIVVPHMRTRQWISHRVRMLYSGDHVHRTQRFVITVPFCLTGLPGLHESDLSVFTGSRFNRLRANGFSVSAGT